MINLPKNWRLVRLADIASNLQSGFAQAPTDSGTVAQVRTLNISPEGCISLEHIKYVTPTKQEIKQYSLRDGDVVFNNTNSEEWVGKTALYTSIESLVFSNHMTRIRVDIELVEPLYLAKYLHFLWAVGYSRQKAKRWVSQAGIDQKALSDFQIALPPIAEQIEIAKILEQAEGLRGLRQESLKKTKELSSTLFLEMFGNPVINSMQWEVKRFSSIGTSRLGKMLDKGKDKGRKQYPYLANYNVQWNCINLSDLRTMELSSSDRKEFSLQEGDLLVCEGGEIGRSAIWRGSDQGVYFQKALHRVRVNHELTTPEYLLHYMWLMAKYDGFRASATPATIAHLTGTQLKKLLVPLPSIEMQEVFSNHVRVIEEQINQLHAQLTELDEFLTKLKHEAFNGQLTETWRKTHSDLQTPTIKTNQINPKEVLAHYESIFPIQRRRKATHEQLSDFQKTVWNYLLEADKYVVDNLPNIIAELHDDITLSEQSRLRTTLATLTTLGLIVKVSVRNSEGEYTPVYRALRDTDEHHTFREQELETEQSTPQPRRKRKINL